MQAHLKWRFPSGALGRLVEAAYERSRALKSRLGELERAAREAPAAPPFAAALRGNDVRLIAELKRRSPSKGEINAALRATDQAAAYEAGGAAALSILTEPAEFGGSNEDLAVVRQTVRIPVLKKDFHVEDVQLLEAKALGASAALLIARAVSPADLERLMNLATWLDLETLVEVRDQGELDLALGLGARVVGVNNRDLETLEIDLRTAERLLPRIPADRVAVWESGVQTRADVERAAAAGADAVLVGSVLSASADVTAAVRDLTGVARVGRD